jgi:Domain of unknown function (DUF4831)
MKLINSIIIVILFLIVGCSTPELVTKFEVTNLKDIDSISTNYFIYSLPQTTLKINFEITKTENTPGPYGEYAEILLGLDQIVDDYNETYTISNVDIDSYLEPDPDEYYVVQFDSNYFQYSFNLSELGFLVSVNDTINDIVYSQFPNGISNLNPVERFSFGETDHFVKRNIVSKKEKRYRTVTTDSSTYRVPYNTTSYNSKSIKDNAEEAANFIIKLRKRKFKLMAGLYENAPDGVAVPEMIKELEELETRYVSLFTGTVNQTKYYFSFDYTPDPNNAIKTFTLCYFSETKGILTLQELSSSPNLEKGMNIRPINVNIDAGLSFQTNLDEVSESLIGKSLIYKLPVYTNVKLVKGNDLFFEKKKQITQFGKKLYIPIHQTKLQKINFNPNNGAINSIQLK